MLIRSFFFLVLILAFNTSFTQEVQIKHYQRKLELENFILPNEKYNSETFSILFPDSIYTAGTVRIKFLKVKKNKTSGTLYFSRNLYFKTIYLVKNKNLEAFFNNKTLIGLQQKSGFVIEKEKFSSNKFKVTLLQKN